MRVIATTDTSRQGTDTYINETVSLVEQYGLYAIISFYEIPEGAALPPDKGADIFEMTTNFEEAKSWYEYYGGKIE
jgi:hypothetical protein